MKKYEIKKRLDEFREVIKSSDERIFAELAFCICTPQSKATFAWNAISSLVKNNLLYTGTEKQIKPFLNCVRFCDNKAKYIIEARNFFSNGKLDIKKKILSFNNSFELRDWLVKRIKGIGLKEASHFIRNIGFDYDNQLAILDRHILKNLKELGIIKEIPESLNKKKYFEIEKFMKNFTEKLKINLYELDILLWSEETGTIFK
jgi:N-glycosylase/DNA lyase